MSIQRVPAPHLDSTVLTGAVTVLVLTKHATNSVACVQTKKLALITTGHRSAKRVSSFFLPRNIELHFAIIYIGLLFVAKNLNFTNLGVSWVEIDVGAVTKGLNRTLIDFLTLEATCEQSVNQMTYLLTIPGNNLFFYSEVR
jgi:hypothetical protein